MCCKVSTRTLGTLLVLAMAASPAAASSIYSYAGSGSVVDGANTYALSASAEFELSGKTLTVLLTNTATNIAVIPRQVLSGVYFDILDAQANKVTIALTADSAFLGAGSSLVHPPAVLPPAYSIALDGIGGEYGYRGDLLGADFDGAQYGISANGLGYFGPGDVFGPGVNLAGPGGPDGMDFGILPTTGLSGSASGLITVAPLVQNAVLFNLSAPMNLEDYRIGNVWFQYGTSVSDPGFPPEPVPEPATVVLLGMGVGAAVARSARRRLLYR